MSGQESVAMEMRHRKTDAGAAFKDGTGKPSALQNYCDVTVNTDEYEDRKENCIEIVQRVLGTAYERHCSVFYYLFLLVMLLGYGVYLGFAIDYDYDESIELIVITSLVIGWLTYATIRDKFGEDIYRGVIKPVSKWIQVRWPKLQWLVYPMILIIAVCYLASIIDSWRQIQSLIGMGLFILIPTFTCRYPSQIYWRPVLWGLALQFIMGILVLRWKPGFLAVRYLSDQISKFLLYSMEGASLAFGDPTFLFHPFFMAVLPLVIYVGAVVGILYHLGLVQAFVQKMSFLMRLTLGTTGIESVSLALNIFLSVAETVLILRPYIPKLTISEFHTLLVGSHATIAGFAYAFFVLLGIDGQHLLTAAVMSAPAAVAIAKLNYPETEVSVFKKENDCQFQKSEDTNVMDAMATGAWQAGKTVSSILVQLVAFYSIYAFVDSVIAYLGARVGIELSFQILFSYIFTPLAYLMGIDWSECGTVAEVLGVKLTASEVLAYMDLGKLKRSRALSERASALTTYAICGFSSFGTLAIFVGVWQTVDPKRVKQVAALVPRIYVNTNLACFLTACVSSILYVDNDWADRGIVRERDIDLSGLTGLLPSYKDLLERVGL